MLLILALALLMFVLCLLSGLPLGLWVTGKLTENGKNAFSIFIAISLIIGFGLYSLSASIAYGATGINTTFFIYGFFSLLTWILYLIKLRKTSLKISFSQEYLYFVLTSFLVSIYFVKSQWNSKLAPRIFAGFGPDVSQNILAAKIANNLGDTWWSAKQSMINSLAAPNLHQASVDIFKLPSFVKVAGYDYLVDGGRWGLTILFSQLSRLIGERVFFLEVGSVLVFSTLVCATIVYAAFRVFEINPLISTIGSVTIVINASFLNLYYNGGLSQAFGMIGNIGLIMILVMLYKSHSKGINRVQKSIFLLLGALSWISSSVSYVDATFLFIIFFVILSAISLIIREKILFKSIANILISGLLATLIIPIFTLAIISNIRYRFEANQGTGVSTGFWNLPTQNVGFFTPYFLSLSLGSKIIFVFSFILIIFFAILIVINIKKYDKDSKFIFAFSTSSIFVIGLGFALAFVQIPHSQYIYNKISSYVAPLFLFSIYLLIIKGHSKFKSDFVKNGIVVSLCLIGLGSSIAIEDNFIKSRGATNFPYAATDLIKDSKLQTYLDGNNYLLPYEPVYSFMGLLGVKYWVSKAPNDMNLSTDDRLGKPLRILCISDDPYCKTKNSKIENQFTSKLKSFGLIEYESSISTLDFSKLTAKERFDFAIKEIGMPDFKIEKKYIGGNPYLNK